MDTNIIVTENESGKLEHTTIDWHGAEIAPFYMQASIPPPVVYKGGLITLPTEYVMPELPEDIDTLPEEERENFKFHHSIACRQQGYIIQTSKIAPVFGAAWELPYFGLTVLLISNILHAWQCGPVQLRFALIMLQQCWSQISSAPCPFHFTPEEIAQHEIEFSDRMEYLDSALLLRRFLHCEADGWVKNEDFEEVWERTQAMEQNWDVEHYKGPFPFGEEK